MKRAFLVATLLAIGALGVSAGVPVSAPLLSAAVVADLADGDHLFFDFDGVLPEAELIKSFNPDKNPHARVRAVSGDPKQLARRLLSADPETTARIERLAGVPFEPLDPAGAEQLLKLGIRELPAVVVVRNGCAHIRQGAAAVDLAALAGCDGATRRTP